MAETQSGIAGKILAYFKTLRFPTLFAISAILFLLDFVVPLDDLLQGPFFPIDEIVLGINTLMLAAWRKQRADLKSEKNTVDEVPDSVDSAADTVNEAPTV